MPLKAIQITHVLREIWGSHGNEDGNETPCRLVGRYERYTETHLNPLYAVSMFLRNVVIYLPLTKLTLDYIN
jgi:hypothetical protein